MITTTTWACVRCLIAITHDEPRCHSCGGNVAPRPVIFGTLGAKRKPFTDEPSKWNDVRVPFRPVRVEENDETRP